MKKINTEKKLELNKKTVSNLQSSDLNKVKGGDPTTTFTYQISCIVCTTK